MGLILNWIVVPVVTLSVGFAAGWEARSHWDAGSQVKAAVHVAAVATKQGAVNTAVAVHDQQARDVIRYVTRTQLQKVTEYVPAPAVADCTVRRGLVSLLNGAASGSDLPELSDAARQSDAAPAGIGLDQVAASVVANYGSSRDSAQELSDLQDWIRQQQAASR